MAEHATRRLDLSPLQMARSDLLAYQVGMDPNYRPGLHHRVVAAALMELEAGHIDRLMIEAPPRHGKTRQIGVDFPSYVLGRHPDWSVGYCTYNKDRAGDVGFFVRENFAHPFHRKCFPAAQIDRRSNSSTKFDLRRIKVKGQASRMAGGYRAVGVGGSLTGRGFDLLAFDDTVKDRQQADSVAFQNRLKNWFSAVAYTRLEGRAAMVSLMTRWGENDLHGHIQREHADDGWVVIRLPALGEPGDFLGRGRGDPLWPERWPLDKLERIRGGLLPRDWMALYQQAPTAIEGLYFSKAWFQWYDIAPAKLNLYLTGDYAVTEEERADFTEMYVWGIDARGHLWLLDGWFGQKEAHVWTAEEAKLTRAHRPRLKFKESGVIRRATESLAKVMHKEERLPYCKTIWLPAVADKAANVTSFQARCAMGMVHFPRTALGRRLAEQLCAFPTGQHDDGVDACGLMGRGLDLMMRAEAREGRVNTPGIRPFTKEWLEYVEREANGLRDT